MVVMGQLGRFMDGIKSKLRGGGGRKTGRKKEAAAMMTYDKMDKTESMRVEIRSRQAQKLIAKNLVAADSIGRRNKRFFLAFWFLIHQFITIENPIKQTKYIFMLLYWSSPTSKHSSDSIYYVVIDAENPIKTVTEILLFVRRFHEELFTVFVDEVIYIYIYIIRVIACVYLTWLFVREEKKKSLSFWMKLSWSSLSLIWSYESNFLSFHFLGLENGAFRSWTCTDICHSLTSTCCPYRQELWTRCVFQTFRVGFFSGKLSLARQNRSHEQRGRTHVSCLVWASSLFCPSTFRLCVT